MGIGQQTLASARGNRGEEEKREVAFYVRAKSGPGRRDWVGVGVAFARRNNEPGFTLKLNAVPIWPDWSGEMVLVPPFVQDDETAPEPEAQPTSRRRRTEEPVV